MKHQQNWSALLITRLLEISKYNSHFVWNYLDNAQDFGLKFLKKAVQIFTPIAKNHFLFLELREVLFLELFSQLREDIELFDHPLSQQQDSKDEILNQSTSTC